MKIVMSIRIAIVTTRPCEGKSTVARFLQDWFYRLMHNVPIQEVDWDTKLAPTYINANYTNVILVGIPRSSISELKKSNFTIIGIDSQDGDIELNHDCDHIIRNRLIPRELLTETIELAQKIVSNL